MTWLWILTAASLAATVANIYRLRACFAVWIGTNGAWAIVDYRAGIPEQATLHVVYLGLAVLGWIRWAKKSSESALPESASGR